MAATPSGFSMFHASEAIPASSPASCSIVPIAPSKTTSGVMAARRVSAVTRVSLGESAGHPPTVSRQGQPGQSG